jgi:hypothetical protein
MRIFALFLLLGAQAFATDTSALLTASCGSLNAFKEKPESACQRTSSNEKIARCKTQVAQALKGLLADCRTGGEKALMKGPSPYAAGLDVILGACGSLKQPDPKFDRLDIYLWATARVRCYEAGLKHLSQNPEFKEHQANLDAIRDNLEKMGEIQGHKNMIDSLAIQAQQDIAAERDGAPKGK